MSTCPDDAPVVTCPSVAPSMAATKVKQVGARNMRRMESPRRMDKAGQKESRNKPRSATGY